jgi:large conductance mechanosensitive channel
MSMIKEFRDFMIRGNVVDLAVAVVIGGAFGKIVTSLVSDIIMPPIGILLGGVDFSSLKFVLKPADAAAKVAEVSINYGVFFNTIIQFVIIGAAIFAVVKLINSVQKPKAVEDAPPAGPTSEELLVQIRDILANRGSGA